MSKYIKQNALLISLSDWQFGNQDDSQLWDTLETIIKAIEKMPTIEVKEYADREQAYMEGYAKGSVEGYVKGFASAEVSEDAISKEWVQDNGN